MTRKLTPIEDDLGIRADIFVASQLEGYTRTKNKNIHIVFKI